MIYVSSFSLRLITETETKADDGWGSTPVDNDAATGMSAAHQLTLFNWRCLIDHLC